MSFIPLSILHRSHLVRILNVTIGCMADAWRIAPITPPHRDLIVTSPRPHRDLTATSPRPYNTLTKPDLSSSSSLSSRAISASLSIVLRDLFKKVNQEPLGRTASVTIVRPKSGGNGCTYDLAERYRLMQSICRTRHSLLTTEKLPYTLRIAQRCAHACARKKK